jgi:hypothetical protein
MKTKTILIVCALFLFITSCKKNETTSEPKLIFKLKLDPTQTRLDNIGNPSTLPAGHAGQDPTYNAFSIHYVELAPTAWTALGTGAVLYHAPETTAGGANAIDFDKCTLAKDGEVLYSLPLSSVKAGSYEWLRVSAAYQNYNVTLSIDTTVSGYPFTDLPCTIASFVGFNTYIKDYKVKTQTVSVNANKAQGYWGSETQVTIPGIYDQPYLNQGQAPAGATTVVNPLNATSPIPPGSCVVTAAFNAAPLVITGKETKDVVVTVAFSTNKSFEWVDLNGDGKWQGLKGEYVVDMGLRGMIPSVQY